MAENDFFWSLIERVRKSSSDQEKRCTAFADALANLSDADCRKVALSFHEIVDQRAYTWKLWGAAYLILGGCSDDGFMDFRACLPFMGKDACERALQDPDTLADIDQDEEAWAFEGFQYAAFDALERAGGGERPDHPDDPSGEEWAEDDLEQLLPRLGKKYRS